ncbi:hypothetical protein L1887_50616 [Cichorium endivia]|nr:hypothetical protein L1887_50616 [Cichorium endivia]
MSAAAKPAAKKAASKKAAGTSVSYEVSSIRHAHLRCRNHPYARACRRVCAQRWMPPSVALVISIRLRFGWMERARASRHGPTSPKIIYCAASPPGMLAALISIATTVC